MKITLGLPCFLIEFMASVEKRGCENVWKMYENSIKSSSNELLGKPGLHNPLCKLFFEQFFLDFMSLIMFVLYVCNS